MVAKNLMKTNKLCVYLNLDKFSVYIIRLTTQKQIHRSRLCHNKTFFRGNILNQMRSYFQI